MKHITVNTYRKDKYYSRVVRAIEKIMKRGVKGTFLILNEYLKALFQKPTEFFALSVFMLMTLTWCRGRRLTISGGMGKIEY